MTQLFPWILPLRKLQRKQFFYIGMKLDKRNYSKTVSKSIYKYKLFEANSQLYNYKTGFDMEYQENKVFNLKLVSKTIDSIVIKPNETFSFWKLARYADCKVPYKDGLTLTDGKLMTTYGGGICQISNLLFWMFLHSPLMIVERHSHKVKQFPDPSEDTLKGVDATVSEGWLDLKVLNNTEYNFQIQIYFDDENIYGQLLTDRIVDRSYEIRNKNISYFKKGDKLYEKVSIYRKTNHINEDIKPKEEHLYDNCCEIGYEIKGL